MEAIVTQRRSELAELCRRYRVQRLELFGSAADDRFDPARIDLDFHVEFLPLVEGEHADAYFGLRESLASLFGRCIDLVMTKSIRNRYFLQQIEPTRTLMYAA